MKMKLLFKDVEFQVFMELTSDVAIVMKFLSTPKLVCGVTERKNSRFFFASWVTMIEDGTSQLFQATVRDSVMTIFSINTYHPLFPDQSSPWNSPPRNN